MVSGSSAEEIKYLADSMIVKFLNFAKLNNLRVNTSKTKIALFGNRLSRKNFNIFSSSSSSSSPPQQQLEFLVGDQTVQPDDKLKILGLWLDSDLHFHKYSEIVAAILRKKSFIIFNHIDKYFGGVSCSNRNAEILRSIYKGYIVPIMTYCAPIRLASFFSTTTAAAVVTVTAPEPEPEEVENQNVTAAADMPNSYDTVILPPHHHLSSSSQPPLPPPPLPSSSSSLPNSNKKSLINSIAKLRSIQRLWLLRITRAKFTTPNMALCLIADVEPIEINLLRRAVDFAVKRSSCRNSITNNHLMTAFSLLYPDRNISESFMTTFFRQQSSTSQSIF